MQKLSPAQHLDRLVSKLSIQSGRDLYIYSDHGGHALADHDNGRLLSPRMTRPKLRDYLIAAIETAERITPALWCVSCEYRGSVAVVYIAATSEKQAVELVRRRCASGVNLSAVQHCMTVGEIWSAAK